MMGFSGFSGQSIRLGVSAAALALAYLSPTSAYAQVASEAADDGDGKRDIVVTGSRGVARSLLDSATPIDVISSTELEATGKPGLISALNTLVPSFNAPARAGGGTSVIISTGGLRGLNPDQTLILVNGKRRHKTSLINVVSALYNGSVPTDLDMIPTAAIDHIEVLRDGAAAQYGSDAIAGVINIILKDGANGGSASFTMGQNFDRSDGETFEAQANYGTRFGAGGSLDLFVNAKKQNPSNRAVPVAPDIQLYNKINGLPDPREATADRLVTRNYGGFSVQQINSGYNLEYDAGPVILYSFGTYGQRNSEILFTFRSANLSPSNTTALPEIHPNGYRPVVNVKEEDLEFLIGAKGEMAGWNWDLSSSYGSNRSEQFGSNTINPSLGPTSPTSFYVGKLKSTEWVNSLDATKGYAVGAGNLQVSGGLQHRLETFSLSRGDPLSHAIGTYSYVVNGVTIRPVPGAQAATGFTPEDEGRLTRNNYAAYLDLAYDPTPDTTIGAAARYEHYDDGSGDTLIGKVNVRQAFTEWFALRGAAGTGFRAPSLAQQIYSSTIAQFRNINGTLQQLFIKTLAVDAPAALALGAKTLAPETSFNLSAGFVLDPFRGFNLTVDAYQIKLKNRIAITSTLSGAAVSAILVANNLPSNISAQYYTNAIDTRTRGVDVVATYKHQLFDNARMSWSMSYNYNDTNISKIAPNPPELSSLGSGYVLFDRRTQANLTENLPKTKLALTNLTTFGALSLNTRLVRYGAFEALANPVVVNGVSSFSNDRHLTHKWLTDVELNWQIKDSISIAIGANNLFNVYPDWNDTTFNQDNGSGQYTVNGGYGFTGGSYYGRLSVSF